jgi:hypothetical protein
VTVHVEIGEIVLYGVAVDDVGEFRAALAAALTGLAAAEGHRLTGREAPSLRAPAIEPAPDALAGDVAGSVWHAVSTGPGPRPTGEKTW